MPNAGYPSVVHGRNVYLSSPDYLREYAAAFVEAGAAIVGGCCGTTPEHIRAMAREVTGRKRANAANPVSVVDRSRGPSTPQPPEIETSRLKRKLAEADEFVVTAEVEPPKGADCADGDRGRAADEGRPASTRSTSPTTRWRGCACPRSRWPR